MANQNKSSLTASRTIPMVLQYLKENGFEEAFLALQIESGLEYEKVSPNKPAQLMEALTCWDDVKSKTDSKSQEISAEQRADEELIMKQSGASAAAGGSGGAGAVSDVVASMDGVHKMNVITCRFHPDAKTTLMATGGADKLVKVTDWTTQTVQASLDCKGPVLTLDFNPAFPNLIAVGCMNNTHRVVDWTAGSAGGSGVNSGATLQEFKDHQKYVVAVRWSPDGRHFVTASHDKNLNVYAASAGPAPAAAADAGAGAAAVGAAAGAGANAGAGAADSKAGAAAVAAAPKQWHLKKTFPFIGAVECVAWRDNDTVVVGVRNDSYLHAVNVHTYQEVERWNMNARNDDHVSFTALDLVFSPNGSVLAVPTDGHRVIVFRSGTNRQVRNLYGFTADGYSNPRLAWSRDGAYLYATSQDMSVVVWELATGKVVRKLSGHTNTIRDVCPHPTRELLLTCGFDKTVRLWRTASDKATVSAGAAPAAAAKK